MSNNPYQSPASDATGATAIGVKSGRREDLRTLAFFQKGVLVCILIYLIVVFVQFALPAETRIYLGIVALVNALVGAVFVILMAMKVYHPVVGVFLGILTLVPCVGLLLLLLINGRATSILKQNGVRVGLMGANLAEV